MDAKLGYYVERRRSGVLRFSVWLQVYVQHKMKKCGAALCDALFEQGGYLFVCGDGLRMASDVHAAVKAIVQEHAGLDASEADDFLRDLAAEKRYVKDVWM